MNRQIAQLNQIESKIVDDKLLQGVVNRASTLSFILAAAFAIYSFTSLDFINGFDPKITLFDNMWPRLLFNTLPLVVLGFYFRRYTVNTHFKSWLWVFALPAIFVAACCIHVWPMIWRGQPEVYFFVHSANVFILTTALIVVAPPPRYIIAQTGAFIVFAALPLAYMFWHLDNTKMMKFGMGDMMIVMPVSAFISLVIHRLRLKIALFDFELRRIAAPFLGSTLTEAIYNQKIELLNNRDVDAIVVQIDIRGFTSFYQNTDPLVVKKFMNLHHAMVSRFVGQHGGYWHKSVGDAHIFSFGAMNEQDRLDEIPGAEKEISVATLRKKRHHFEAAMATVQAIVGKFNALKEDFDISDNVGLGVGMASGTLEVRIQGDDEFRKELDIDGAVVIRAARLEQYSKTIREMAAPDASVVVVSPELGLFIERDVTYRKWEIDNDERAVRNFPELKYLYYCPMQAAKSNDQMSKRGAA